MFESAERGPIDPMFELKKRADSDFSPEKVDLGVGVYRNELGQYHELRCIQKASVAIASVTRAKKTLASRNPGHDYELTTGNTAFLSHAAELIFGKDCEALRSEKIASVQTISGTGANHLGALLVSRCAGKTLPRVYIGTPTWSNHEPLFRLMGFEVVHYNYYDSEKRCVDFDACIEAVKQAPKGSVFVLQGCCHNPTGVDFNREQWQSLANEVEIAQQLPFFDIAYQGLGDGLDEDAFGIRLFTSIGFELIACQSFSKNFGLYGERVGALHIVNRERQIAVNVHEQLRSLIRWEFSSSPAFGSRLANSVFENEEENKDWLQELSEIRKRLQRNRSHLFDLLNGTLETPGNWSHILRERGLFSYLKLSSSQCQILTDEYHVYLPANGRINVAGLNESCFEQVALAIDAVVRKVNLPYFSGTEIERITQLENHCPATVTSQLERGTAEMDTVPYVTG